MTKKITDLEGRLDAAFDRADKTTEDSLARLCEKQRLKIAEFKEQRNALLEAVKHARKGMQIIIQWAKEQKYELSPANVEKYRDYLDAVIARAEGRK